MAVRTHYNVLGVAPDADDAMLPILAEMGARHEADHRDELLAEGRALVQIERGQEALAHTMAAIRVKLTNIVLLL